MVSKKISGLCRGEREGSKRNGRGEGERGKEGEEVGGGERKG